MKQDRIVILDLGSTENTTIARAVRALGVYSEIYPHDISAAELTALPGVKGVIVNGGPNHVVDGREIFVADEVYACGLPVLAVDHPAAKTERKLAAWPEEDKLADALRPFVFDVCGAEANWNMPNFIADQIEEVRRQVGDKKVLLALSGGVDSSVVAALLLRAIGDQLTCVHVNHGLLRKGEPEQVVEVFQKQLGANLVYVDASERFLGKLAGVADPEQKRKIIGAEFIRVFEEEARKLEGIDFRLPRIDVAERYFLDYDSVSFSSTPKYSYQHPIPECKVYEHGTIYRILLGTFNTKRAVSTFRGAYPLSYLVNDDRKWCYYAGGFATREEAEAAQKLLKARGFVRPEIVVWTDGEYRNLSKDPEAQHIAYRVEIVSSEALSDAVKAAITDTAEGCELSRVGQQLFVVGTFDDKAVADRVAAAVTQTDPALEIKVAEIAE